LLLSSESFLLSSPPLPSPTMRTSIFLIALVACVAVSAVAQSTGGAGPGAVSICERATKQAGLDWSSSKDQYTAISTLIVRIAYGTNTAGGAAAGVFNAAITAPYFNGQVTYRNGTISPNPFKSQVTGGLTPNFNAAAYATSLAQLVAHLVQFFGPSLGCKTGNTDYPAYVSSYAGTTFTQYNVHANMQIGNSVFSSFNNQVVAAVVSMLPTPALPADAAAVQAVLANFGRNNQAGANANMICTAADCPCATGVTGSNCDNVNAVASTSASFVTLAAAALVALFAMRR
jgi:hypothetical protein